VAGISVYDATLRDGAQREGLSLSADDKLKIAQKLDELGVAFIEGGYPRPTQGHGLFPEGAPGHVAPCHAVRLRHDAS